MAPRRVNPALRLTGNSFVSVGPSNYHAAHTCAMPDPIKPPPIIVTRWIADLHDVVDIDLTWKLAQVFSIVKQQLYYFLLQCTTKLKLQLKPEVKGHKSTVRGWTKW